MTEHLPDNLILVRAGEFEILAGKESNRDPVLHVAQDQVATVIGRAAHPAMLDFHELSLLVTHLPTEAISRRLALITLTNNLRPQIVSELRDTLLNNA